MENNNNDRRLTDVENSSMSWTKDQLSLDPFEAQNFSSDNVANGTTEEMFDRRRVIDQKNLVELFVGRFGIKWVSVIG